MNASILLAHGLVVVTGGKQYSISNDHPNYSLCLEALKAKDWEKIPSLVDLQVHINTVGQNKITVVDGKVMWGAKEMHNGLTKRLLEMLSAGFDIDPMIVLLENLLANPTTTAIDEFMLFFEQNEMPITEDGCITAYKLVSSSFFDFYTFSVLNKPYHLMTDEEKIAVMEGDCNIGNVTITIEDKMTTVSVPRESVDDNRRVECSHGLHFCSLGYINVYQSMQNTRGVILILKINPRDIVSIPHDYSNTKGRCMRYQIVGCLEVDADAPHPETDVYATPVLPSTADFIAHLAYDAGYVDGRNKIPLDPEADGWYVKGYRDGRGKKKRQLPKLKTHS